MYVSPKMFIIISAALNIIAPNIKIKMSIKSKMAIYIYSLNLSNNKMNNLLLYVVNQINTTNMEQK